MEKKKTNVAKIIFRVIGIIFSIVLVPALILWIPVGGAAIGVSSSVSQEGLLQIADEANLSEHIFEIVEDEVVKGVKINQLKQEYVQGIILDSISEEWIDDVLEDVLEAAYKGKRPNISIEPVIKSFRNELDSLAKNGFQDIYSAWVNDTPSAYFSESFVQSFWEKIENELIGEYAEFEVSSLGMLEEKYDERYGEGAFSDLLDEKMQSFEETWDEEFSAEIDGKLDEIIETTEEEINDTVYEVIQEPDLRTAFDYLQEMSEKSNTIKLLAYGVLFAAILILVGCFWFGTAGFVVSAVPIIIGGVLCKVIVALESKVLGIVDDVVAKEAELAEYGAVVHDMAKGIVTPLFDAVSKFGTTAIIIGVVLIGLGIMSGVIKKNKSVTE